MRAGRGVACALAIGLGALAGCAVGAPPGFSDGDSWSFPLVAPLEDGALVAPVKVNGKGPYLFLIDPDSRESSVDDAIASELELYPIGQRELLDEGDRLKRVGYVEVKNFTLGNLTVSNREVRVHKVNTYSTGGRRMRGVIGGDVLADSLVFSFDRDAGMAYLTTQKFHTPAADAMTIEYSLLNSKSSRGAPVSRRLTKVKINDAFEVWMHLDLSGQASQLRASVMDAHKMPKIPAKITLADELGTPRQIDRATIAATVTVGAASRSGVFFLPYGDQRWRDTDLDGTLGLNFFTLYNVAANWHTKTLYLEKRDLDASKTIGARLARWESTILDACPVPACVEVTVLDDATGQPVPAPAAAPVGEPAAGEPVAGEPAAGEPAVPPEGGPVAPPEEQLAPRMMPTYHLQLQRTAEAAASAYDVILEAADARGERMPLPRLLVVLPANVPSVMLPVDVGYAGAQLRVLDVNPFPRECLDAGGCVWQLSDTL